MRALAATRRLGLVGALALLAATSAGFAQETPEKTPYFKPERPADEIPMDTPAQRAKLLAAFYAQLAKAANAQEAAPVAEAIERLWLHSGSDTIALLMDRSAKAIAEKNWGSALRFLDAVVTLAPDFAEGWNRRAYVFFMENEHQRALGDLRRVMALDPHHYKALDGVGQILREIGEKKAALQAFRELERIHPNWPGVRQTVNELEREVEGQGI